MTNKLPSRAYGVETGLMFGQFLVKIFDEQVSNHRSDARIVKMIRKEFPLKEQVDYDRYMNMYRNIYNRGEWPCQQGVAPANPIAKYDKKGDVIKPKAGPQPRTEPL